MKKLKTDIDGGMPIVLDDIRFMYESLSDTVKGLVSPFNDVLNPNDLVILSGLEIEVGPIAGLVFKPGIVAFQNEIFEVSGCDFEAYPLEPYFVIEKNYDSEGLKVFKLTGGHDTYEIRTMKIIFRDTPPSEPHFKFSMDCYIWTRIHTKLQSYMTAETNVNHQVIPSVGTYDVYGRIDFSGTIHLCGRHYGEDLSDNTTLFTLPYEFRPEREQTLILPLATSVKAVCVKIATSGVVTFKGWANGVGSDYSFVMSFDGITYQQNV
ncbi:MAG TPA: hypothetical protein PLP27_10995 [Crocinitomicaceae bacterium]|nr:hypothetical protein [Crocinitomicaceae bacterium]